MVNQSQANQSAAQVQHAQSPQQSQSPQQQAKTQILQQFTPSIQLQPAGGTGQQQYGKYLQCVYTFDYTNARAALHSIDTLYF